MKKEFINYGFLLTIVLIYFISLILVIYALQPIFKSGAWVIAGSFIFLSIVLLYSTKQFPLILKIFSDKSVFYGAFCSFSFKREWLDEIIVDTGGFIFKPKPEHMDKYRKATELPQGEWKGYKVIAFINPKGLGEFVKAMKPITGDRIEWNKMSEKRKKYWWNLLYGEE